MHGIDVILYMYNYSVYVLVHLFLFYPISQILYVWHMEAAEILQI